MISFTYILHNQEKTINAKSLNGYDLSKLHLHRLSYNDKYKLSFENAHSTNANFFSTTLRSVYFTHCIFENCCFDKAKFYAVTTKRTVFDKSSSQEADFSSDFKDSTFSLSDFQRSSFRSDFLRFWFIDNIFDSCYFKNTKFENCLFGDCIFKNCTFENCEFIDCNIYENIDTNNQFIKCENPFIKVES